MPEYPPRTYYSPENDDANHSLYPYLRNLVMNIDAKKICDFGCGNGRLWSPNLYENSDRKIILFDPLIDEISNFPSRLDEYSERTNLSEDVNSNSCDLVICSLVLMTLPTLDEFDYAISEIKRIMKPKGKGLFAISHPCFLDRDNSEFSTSFANHSKDFDYLKNGLKFTVELHQYKGDKLVLTDWHRPLSTYFDEFYKHSLKVNRFHELPSTSYANLKQKFPSFLIFEVERYE